MAERVLVVDDEEGIRETLAEILADEGYRYHTVGSVGAARAALAEQAFDLVLLDVWLPDGDGVDFLVELRSGLFDGPVVVISGHGNIDTAVRAIREGAFDFLEKPLSLSRVVLTVDHALQQRRMERELETLSQRFDRDETLQGASPAMRKLKEQLKVVAPSESRILITGENGTGKELVAREVHRRSARSAAEFVALNCAAIPEELIESELFGHVKGAFTGATANRTGRFVQADGGTLFLDEIADMSLKTQAKVLRVLEEQRFERVGDTRSIEVDVRVLAATNKDLEDEIAEGRFRQDLYFRLAVIPLRVPPLRERREDIPQLVEHFLATLARQDGRGTKRADPEVMRCLQGYSWPGNVRELRNLAERLLIMAPGPTITVDDLPANLRRDQATPFGPLLEQEFGSLKDAREAFERAFIERQLERAEGNVTQTARALGLERSSLHRKLKSYGIEPARP
ncbi:MAG: sigma-54-dependent Fis family transcriptional regulator [Acidobacteria bacterium]|nr:MAG: sigma-54-dependent Fis family transcriptional regulator [Acidobacteriota bacterium]REK11786.1 MAG: sigma-54-dependent Fis family transcriptional regulator [Acidobacteriota bacterium]